MFALSMLGIIYIGLTLFSVIGIFAMFFVREKVVSNVIFGVMFAFSLMLVAINFTALPENYMNERIIACILCGISLLAIGIKLFCRNTGTIANLILSGGIVLTLLDIFI